VIRFRERYKYSKGERTEEIAETNGVLPQMNSIPHLAVPKPCKGEKNYEKVKSTQAKGVAPVEIDKTMKTPEFFAVWRGAPAWSLRIHSAR
jgi:hypothetical protein